MHGERGLRKEDSRVFNVEDDDEGNQVTRVETSPTKGGEEEGGEEDEGTHRQAPLIIICRGVSSAGAIINSSSIGLRAKLEIKRETLSISTGLVIFDKRFEIDGGEENLLTRAVCLLG